MAKGVTLKFELGRNVDPDQFALAVSAACASVGLLTDGDGVRRVKQFKGRERFTASGGGVRVDRVDEPVRDR